MHLLDLTLTAFSFGTALFFLVRRTQKKEAGDCSKGCASSCNSVAQPAAEAEKSPALVSLSVSSHSPLKT